MKKLFAVLVFVVVLFSGCAGLNAPVATSIATDIAFVEILKNNPGHKEGIIAGLEAIRGGLDVRGVTYNDLVVNLNSAFDGEYAYVAIILMAYIETDTPVFQGLPMLESYKEGVRAKIDRYMMLVELAG